MRPFPVSYPTLERPIPIVLEPWFPPSRPAGQLRTGPEVLSLFCPTFAFAVPRFRNGGLAMARLAFGIAFVVASLVALSVALAVACLALLLTPQAATAQEARQDQRQNTPGQFDFY